jgi:glycosyltransferase involved in cell wall biosynthesis
VVVVVYNIPREAPRTLLSLSPEYQRGIEADDYEVIVVDNGSTPPFDASELARRRGNFRLIRIDAAPASPAQAVNCGLAAARGDVVGVLIDGARLVTPGLLHYATLGATSPRRWPRRVIRLMPDSSISPTRSSGAAMQAPRGRWRGSRVCALPTTLRYGVSCR